MLSKGRDQDTVIYHTSKDVVEPVVKIPFKLSRRITHEILIIALSYYILSLCTACKFQKTRK